MNRRDMRRKGMQYREHDLPVTLSPFVKAVWELTGDGDPDHTLGNEALPDGCIEIIHRLRGRSGWHGDQPEYFVAGLCSAPAQLTISANTAFVGIRVWPWAWNAIGQPPCPQFHDSWRPLETGSAMTKLCESAAKVVARLEKRFAACSADPIGRHVPQCRSPGEIAERSGMTARTVQRWFQREIGLSARRYFQLLRFQRAIGERPTDAVTLADEAASLGYADQAHMSRDFRSYSKRTAGQVRARAKGPFI